MHHSTLTMIMRAEDGRAFTEMSRRTGIMQPSNLVRMALWYYATKHLDMDLPVSTFAVKLNSRQLKHTTGKYKRDVPKARAYSGTTQVRSGSYRYRRREVPLEEGSGAVPAAEDSPDGRTDPKP